MHARQTVLRLAAAILPLAAMAPRASADDALHWPPEPSGSDVAFAVAYDSAQPPQPLDDTQQPAAPLNPQPPFAPPPVPQAPGATTAPGQAAAPGQPSVQPPAAESTTPRRPASASTLQRRSLTRLASVPNMFGDAFGGFAGISSTSISNGIGNGNGSNFQRFFQVEVSPPLAGGLRRTKIAENNKPVPQDQFVFMYHHFHNAVQLDIDTASLPPFASTPQNYSLDAYTVGFEKALGDGLCSIGVRMPFAGDDFTFDTLPTSVSGGEYGNLNVSFKTLLYYDGETAFSAGLAVDTPTGSDADGRILGRSFLVENQSVHLMPYIGFLRAPTGGAGFCQSFLQVDVPANGNDLTVDSPGGLPNFEATLDDQTLLYLDLSTGYWLHRWQQYGPMAGLAALFEVHYTTALNDADLVTRVEAVPQFGRFTFGNTLNRFDVVNLSTGLHAGLGPNCAMRVLGSFPLTDDHDRFFDAEVGVQTYVGF